MVGRRIAPGLGRSGVLAGVAVALLLVPMVAQAGGAIGFTNWSDHGGGDGFIDNPALLPGNFDPGLSHTVGSVVPAASTSDPLNDHFHATDQPPGVTPPEIDGTAMTVAGHLTNVDALAGLSGDVCGTESGGVKYFCDSAVVHGADWSQGMVVALWETAAAFGTTPNLEVCEFVYGVNSGAGGTPWQPFPDFPNDGFGGLNATWGMRHFADDSMEFFGWTPDGFSADPGVIVTETSDGTGWGMGIPAAAVPGGDPSVIVSGRIYMFCTEGGFEASVSGADWMNVAYDQGYPAFTVTSTTAAPVDPAPTDTQPPTTDPEPASDDGGFPWFILVILLFLIALLFWWLFGRKKDDDDDDDPRDTPPPPVYGEEIDDACCEWGVDYTTLESNVVVRPNPTCAKYTVGVVSRLEDSSAGRVNYNGLGDVIDLAVTPTTADVTNGVATVTDFAHVYDTTVIDLEFSSTCPHTHTWHVEAQSEIMVTTELEDPSGEAVVSPQAWVDAKGEGDIVWFMDRAEGDSFAWSKGVSRLPGSPPADAQLGNAHSLTAPTAGRGQVMGGAVADIGKDIIRIRVTNIVAAQLDIEVPEAALAAGPITAKIRVDARHWLKATSLADCQCQLPWCTEEPRIALEVGQAKPFQDLEDQQSTSDAVLYVGFTDEKYLHRSERDPDDGTFPFHQAWAIT